MMWLFFAALALAVSQAAVPTSDYTLLPVEQTKPKFGAISIASYDDRCPYESDKMCDLPIYKNFNSDTDEFFDNMIDEQLLARVDHLVLVRACYNKERDNINDGFGDACGYRADRVVKAIQRAGATGAIKMGVFDDNAAWVKIYNRVLKKNDDKFNFADRSGWRILYDHVWRPFFKTVPRGMWMMLEGKPVIAFWTFHPGMFTNYAGNAGALMTWIKATFKAEFGVEPALIAADTLNKGRDPSFSPSQVFCQHAWFTSGDRKSWSWFAVNGRNCGAIAPAFRDGHNVPGCGAACREVPRRNGDNLREALRAGSGGVFSLLEGWNNVRESAGFYRAESWSFPNQYISILRSVADSAPATLRFQAEGADAFSDTTAANLGNSYRVTGSLDIAPLKASPINWQTVPSAYFADRVDDSSYDLNMAKSKCLTNNNCVAVTCKGTSCTLRSGTDPKPSTTETSYTVSKFSGYYVGWTEPGEWLEYKEIKLGCGTYRFTARVATADTASKLRLEVSGKKLPEVTLPNTGGMDKYDYVHLGQTILSPGTYSIRVHFVTKGINLDWYFLKRSSKTCTLGAIQACDSTSWSNVNKWCENAPCKVLAYTRNQKTCHLYCAAQGHSCKGAWEDLSNTCAAKPGVTQADCNTNFVTTYAGTSDMICECDTNPATAQAEIDAGESLEDNSAPDTWSPKDTLEEVLVGAAPALVSRSALLFSSFACLLLRAL